MSDAPMGFGLAALKEEGGTFILDEITGEYRKMTQSEIAAYREREAAEAAYSRTKIGRFRRFLHRVGVAWRSLREDDGL